MTASFIEKLTRWQICNSPVLNPLRPIPGWTTGFQTDTRDYKTRKKIFSSAQAPFIARWRQDLKFVISPHEEISHCLFCAREYEPNQLFFLQQNLKRGMVFADVGAHCGIFTLFAAKLVGSTGRVYAFEASQREFLKLTQNLRLNPSAACVVEPHPSAVWSEKTTLDLKVANFPTTGHNSVFPFIHSSTRSDFTQKTEAITLSDFFSEALRPTPDIIKLDVEGAEFKVLQGAQSLLKSKRPVIMLEIVSGPKNEDIWNFLTNLGYSLYAYDLKSGLPHPVNRHPGAEHTDFIARHKLSIGR